ncbi:MAG: ABC transporter permease subunit [Chloroflexi bacterium]|nr:ABC transporter permease subunit [Chloroflexota bacterium]
MPWILLGIILVFSQMPIWGGFFDYKSRAFGEIRVERANQEVVHTGLTCADIRAGRVPTLPADTEPYVIQGIQERCDLARVAQTMGFFTLPYSLTFSFSIGQVLGMLLLAVLTASMLGTEYSWGTLRTILARGTGRWQYLTAKLALIVLFAASVWVIIGAATVLNSLLATSLAPKVPPEVADLLAVRGAGWSSTLIVTGRAFVSIVPYLAMAAFVTVLTTSLAAGIAVSLGYYFAEAIGAALLINVVKVLSGVTDYLLVRNIGGWMLGSKEQVLESQILLGPFGFGQYPSEVHAIFVMLAYTLFFGALSFWLFRRRDVSGASGG